MSEVECDVSLGLRGNPEGFLASGWSQPEAELTWSNGAESTIVVHPRTANADYLVILQGRPYLRRPDIRAQRVHIFAAEKELAVFAADDETQFVSWFRVRSLPQQGAPIRLAIHLPDNASPSAVGLLDTRRLGIALIRLRLIKLSYSSDGLTPYSLEQNLYENTYGSDAAAKLRQATSALIARCDFPGARGLLASQVPEAIIDAHQLSSSACDLLSYCLISQEQTCLSQMLASLFHWPDLHADFYDCPTNDPAVARIEFLGSGALRILFSKSISKLDRVASWGAIRTISSYALSVIPLFINYATSRRIAGSVNVTLADEAHVRGLAFSGRTPDTTLIPDPVFLATHGYSRFRTQVLEDSLEWARRRSVVFWRGSTTGTRRGHSVWDLDRVRLCLLARQHINRPYFDVGLAGLSQLTEQESQQLSFAELMKEFVPPERLNEWKYSVDIDGNSNSWAGTLQKLLSGCLLLKVESRDGWRQWYYDLLRPFENFVPVHHDLSDLPEKSKYLIYNDHYAEAIAQAGQELAFSLSFDSEVHKALAAIERGVVYDWVP